MRGDGPVDTNLYLCHAWFPPHARGWTGRRGMVLHPPRVSPACAGMDRFARAQRTPATRFPRMRGDGPSSPTTMRGTVAFPPHARGWTRWVKAMGPRSPVSPACAGMDRRSGRLPTVSHRFPRMRGDGPLRRYERSMRHTVFPPHARGWTSCIITGENPCGVSPACAGMDRSRSCPSGPRTGFPRMRGDGPVDA